MGGEEPADPLRFTVLGPVRAWQGITELPLGARQQRCFLAVLLLRAGTTVPAEELVDALWGERPPLAALGTVRTYAYRLRRILGYGTIGPDAGGYRVDAAPGSVDAAECERLAAEAARHRAAGRAEAALTALRQALSLWHGEALPGLPGPYAERQRARWAERRLELLEARLETELELGRHDRITGELAELADAHPMRERVSHLRMLALYRAGRQAEALDAYAAARRTLITELGVEPGPELRELHGRILAADPALAPAPGPLRATANASEAPAAAPPAAPSPEPFALPPTSLPAPRQLPAKSADFCGRQAEKAALRRALLAPGTPVAVVCGLGGVGKTELAVHLAHSLAAHFPDGQLYADLHGEDGRPTPPEEILGSFIGAFGIRRDALPAGLTERSVLLRSVLAGRRVLLVLDNARDARQVRPLLPGGPGCAVLVTSRARLTSLTTAHPAELGVLGPEEALQLLTALVGEDRVRADEPAARELLAACGHLPLAVRITAARLVHRPFWTLAGILPRFADGRRRLDFLRTGDLAVETVFRSGYDRLEPAQARAFRLLAVPDTPDLPLDAVAALLGLPREKAEELAESLADASMLETPAPGRYRYHGLLRDFARALGTRAGTRGEPAGQGAGGYGRV
ncbi:BTAD domain-containing putative transcriptional regulator [Streptomyces sp. NPDC020379]|uniref:AfsR/SARP family transcriptional regulator n=1 Tax=Streptomyces sp. NPDC020379 TaxID=3365071 RepID=UPI0037BA44DA